MIKEFTYTFKGFTNCYSKCFIRMIYHEHGPFVIMCSQTDKIIGTSICNAFEKIRAGLEKELKNQSRGDKLEKFKDLYEKHKKLPIAITSFLVEILNDFLKNKKNWYKRFTSTDKLVWIEHWPKTLDFMEEDEYLLVNWDGENEPKWDKVDINYLADETGYDVSELQITKFSLSSSDLFE